jgi:hypothetical protein
MIEIGKACVFVSKRIIHKSVKYEETSEETHMAFLGRGEHMHATSIYIFGSIFTFMVQCIYISN